MCTWPRVWCCATYKCVLYCRAINFPSLIFNQLINVSVFYTITITIRNSASWKNPRGKIYWYWSMAKQSPNKERGKTDADKQNFEQIYSNANFKFYFDLIKYATRWTRTLWLNYWMCRWPTRINNNITLSSNSVFHKGEHVQNIP